MMLITFVKVIVKQQQAFRKHLLCAVRLMCISPCCSPHFTDRKPSFPRTQSWQVLASQFGPRAACPGSRCQGREGMKMPSVAIRSFLMRVSAALTLGAVGRKNVRRRLARLSLEVGFVLALSIACGLPAAAEDVNLNLGNS